MEQLILFSAAFILAFGGRLILYLLSKRTKKKQKKKNRSGIAVEMKYLAFKFKLKQSRLDNKKMATLISFLDALIVASTFALVTMITDNMILEFILGIVLVMTLIYIIYEILGKILKKRGFDKDGL